MSVLIPQFDVLVLPDMTVKNKAVVVENALRSMIAIAGKEEQIMVGKPVDNEGDNFYVTEWGVEGDEEIPDWITFLNVTIQSGIKFQINPAEKNENEKFTVFYAIRDDDLFDPKEAKFTFIIEVKLSKSDELIGKSFDSGFVEGKARNEIIKVVVEEPDS